MSELVLINPRRRRRRAKSSRRRRGRMPPALAAYWAGKRGRKRRRLKNPSRRRARSRRRRSVMVMGAPRRVRRRRIRVHRKRRARMGGYRARRRHRNPRFGLPSVQGMVRQTLIPGAIGAGGALALDVAYGYASGYLPAFFQNKWATLGVKILGAVGIGMLASRFLGRERGRAAMVGAATVVVYGVAKSALASALPTVKGLSGYMDYVDYSVGSRNGGVGFYSPAPTVGAYMPQLGAYMAQPAPAMGGLEGVEGYDWRSDGM